MKDFLPYFAGYVDGDGHFRFRKYIQDGYECFNCKIMITSTNEEPFKFFKEKIGGSYYAKVKKESNWKQEFIYTLHIGKEKFNIISELGNFLIEKKSQFQNIEKFLFGNREERISIIEESKKLRNSDFCTIEHCNRIKKVCNSINPSKEDFIYLAGFIDSECCLTVTRKVLKTNSVSFSCHLRCASTKFPCIKFLVERFGGCIYFKTSKNDEWANCIQWQLTDKSLENILPKFNEFLINKRDQSKQIIALRETYVSRKFPRDKDFISYYNHYTPIRESIYSKVKSLNKRGL